MHATFDLPPYQLSQRLLIQRKIISKRRYDRCPASFEPHFVLPALSGKITENFAKLVHAFFADHPVRGPQRAARKSFPAPRRVANRNGVLRRIESNFMSAWHHSSAVRAQTDFLRVAVLFHVLRKRQKRSGRRVLFRGMMNLPAPRAVALFAGESPCSLRHNLTKKIQSHRKIRAPDQCVSAFLKFSFYLWYRREPPGRPTNRRNPGVRQLPQILGGRIWPGEFHRNIYALECVTSQHLSAGIFLP